MRVLNVRNVCEALPQGIDLLLSGGVKSPSRAGDVLVAPWPVATVYSHPRERVLFSPIRDANPAFHLAESLWLLAGRNDAAFLNLFIKDFGERFAEPNGTIHGAYGYRWRKAFGFDQLKHIVRRLIENPNDRQAVLQMWDCMESTPAEFCAISGNDDLQDNWRDRPCNTHVYFRVRDGLLDMGVCCRSNDLIMGLAGTNAVAFSILQEYMAAMIDVGVGTYTQFSFNYHVYMKDLDMLQKRFGIQPLCGDVLALDYYRKVLGPPLPLVDEPATFDEDVEKLLRAVEQNADSVKLDNYFLAKTAWPLLKAYLTRDLELAKKIKAPDWGLALVEWLQRRRRQKHGP